MKRILLLSNSTMPGQPFFSWPENHVRTFLGTEVKKILFFPFAGVMISFDEYFTKVAERFLQIGYHAVGAHTVSDKVAAIEACDAIVVGGGNTFQLVSHLHNGWIDLIREKVKSGAPYIGWSAGSNVACPTIKTTNDMPIIQPKSFEALNLVPFQINPHYTEASISNHGGETRPDRIREFLVVNPDVQVMGLPEGSLLQVEGKEVAFKGTGELTIFKLGEEIKKLPSDYTFGI